MTEKSTDRPVAPTEWSDATALGTGDGGDNTASLHVDAGGLHPELAGCDPFSLLPNSIVTLLESRMHERRFAAGESLMQQGEEGTSLMVLCEGNVEISTTDEQGVRRDIARTARPQVLGEMALLTREPRSASVVALAPVRARVLPAETFHEMARQHPAISVVLTALIARRLGRSERDDVLAGKTLEGYRIVRRLGRGGMSVVYEAEDTARDRRVALKMMSHRLVYDAAALYQFQREADLIEAFDHPNIVGTWGRFAAFHTYFIVMPLCDGVGLDRVIRRRGALPAGEVRKVLGQVASALAYAHRAGVVHRDVKPSNVFLDREGRALLMDFGVASPIEGGAAGNDRLIVGTPRYMAPEQLAGEAASPAADYFAFGCLAYELLSGEPFLPSSGVSGLSPSHPVWTPPDYRGLFPLADDELANLLSCALRPQAESRRIDLDAIAAWSGPLDASRLAD